MIKGYDEAMMIRNNYDQICVTNEQITRLIN
jgi:hypothetical protein